MKLAEKLREKRKRATALVPSTPYQKVAKKFGTTVVYVGQIARGDRIPKRKNGKGMKILQELERMCNETNN